MFSWAQWLRDTRGLKVGKYDILKILGMTRGKGDNGMHMSFLLYVERRRPNDCVKTNFWFKF